MSRDDSEDSQSRLHSGESKSSIDTCRTGASLPGHVTATETAAAEAALSSHTTFLLHPNSDWEVSKPKRLLVVAGRDGDDGTWVGMILLPEESLEPEKLEFVWLCPRVNTISCVLSWTGPTDETDKSGMPEKLFGAARFRVSLPHLSVSDSIVVVVVVVTVVVDGFTPNKGLPAAAAVNDDDDDDVWQITPSRLPMATFLARRVRKAIESSLLTSVS